MYIETPRWKMLAHAWETQGVKETMSSVGKETSDISFVLDRRIRTFVG